nr:MAG TPA: hypothetical protein [Caudoviricetes sp.]
MKKVKVMVLTEDWTLEKAKEVAREVASNEFESFIKGFAEAMGRGEDYFTPSVLTRNLAVQIYAEDLPIVDIMFNWLDHGLVKLDDGIVDENGHVNH